MQHQHKIFSAVFAFATLFSGCTSTPASSAGESQASSVSIPAEAAVSALAQIDQTKWRYHEQDNVYWQVGISYCVNPAYPQYETLGIFVPGDDMTVTDNGDGTFRCEMNSNATLGGYTAATAPFVIPVEAPGYSEMAAPTGYDSSISVYTNAGCRGRDAGAPAGVTDLIAAIRYIRYNEGTIPGNTDRIFSFGMSGGGRGGRMGGVRGTGGTPRNGEGTAPTERPEGAARPNGARAGTALPNGANEGTDPASPPVGAALPDGTGAGTTPPARPDGTGAENEYYAMDGIDRNNTSGGVSISGTYETVQDYIDALNANST